MKLRLVLLLSLVPLVAAAHCRREQEPVIKVDAGVPEVVVPPADPPGEDSAECMLAFERVTKLGCALPNNWVPACEAAEKNGIDMRTECVIAAPDCASVNECLGRSPQR